jgi:hypothetical protein
MVSNVLNVLSFRYEVRFQNGQDCGGAYVKLLSNDDLDLVIIPHLVTFPQN